MAGPPVVNLVASQARAVDARLLPRSQTDNHAVLGIADGVGLDVLGRDGGDKHVDEGGLGDLILSDT